VPWPPPQAIQTVAGEPFDPQFVGPSDRPGAPEFASPRRAGMTVVPDRSTGAGTAMAVVPVVRNGEGPV
jgi:hypothetical protein